METIEESEQEKKKLMLYCHAQQTENLAIDCYLQHFPNNHQKVIAAIENVIFQRQTFQEFLVSSSVPDSKMIQINKSLLTGWRSIRIRYHSNVNDALSGLGHKALVLKEFPFSFILEDKNVETEEERNFDSSNRRFVQQPDSKGRLLLLKNVFQSYFLVKVGYIDEPIILPKKVRPRIYKYFAQPIYLWNKPDDRNHVSQSNLLATVLTALSEFTQLFDSISLRPLQQFSNGLELRFSPITIANCMKICSILNSLDVLFEFDAKREAC